MQFHWLTLSVQNVNNFTFPCSLTRNISSHSMKNLALYSSLRRKMIIQLPILTTARCSFLTLGSGPHTVMNLSHDARNIKHDGYFPICTKNVGVSRTEGVARLSVRPFPRVCGSLLRVANQLWSNFRRLVRRKKHTTMLGTFFFVRFFYRLQ